MRSGHTLRPTAEPIDQSLKSDIMAGTLAPGAPLRQDGIARQHGVSKIPVREVLLRLEVDDLVLFRKKKGANLREISPTEILHLMDVRIALECRALELALPQKAESDLMVATALLEEYDRKSGHEGWSTFNERFHETLYEPCANGPLLQMIRECPGAAATSGTTRLHRPQREHRAILAACQRGDGARAGRLLRAHIETTRKETAARLRRTRPI